jgi:hypothetical protein
MSLVFYPKSHRYRLDGAWVPGVTTLIGKGLPKPALVYWSAKMVAEFVADREADVEQLRRMGRGPMVAALKATPWQERDEAAIRGTDIHALAEELAHGREVEVPEHLADPVDGYVRWLDAWSPEVIWTERPVANRRWWYAGKPDVVCRIGSDVWLLDWKSSKAVYGDNALQVAAYGNAEFSVNNDGDEEPMPHIDRYGVVHVQPHATELYEVKQPELALKDFLHVLWTAKAEDRIKGYLGEPINPPSTEDAA